MSRDVGHPHPLRAFFHARNWTAEQGMDWLQGAWLQGRTNHGALISDNCIDPEDVAACDTDRILRLAGAEMFIPTARRTPEDEARLQAKREARKRTKTP